MLSGLYDITGVVKVSSFNHERMKFNNLVIHLVRDELVNIMELCQMLRRLQNKDEFEMYMELLNESAFNAIKKCEALQELLPIPPVEGAREVEKSGKY